MSIIKLRGITKAKSISTPLIKTKTATIVSCLRRCGDGERERYAIVYAV